MNMRMIEQYHARQRRKRALVISLIIHGIFVIGVAVWLLKPIIEEIEDHITIDIIGVSEQQVQVPKKQVVKKSEANTPVKQAAKRSEVTRKPTSTAAARLSTPAAKRLSPSMSALPKVVMADPKFEPPDASTLANLTPEPDSFLVPGAPDVDVARGSGEAVSGSGVSRRKGQGTGNKPGPGRGGGGTGRGLGDAVKGGFKGQDDLGEGIGEGDGDGSGAGDGDGTGAEQPTFGSIIKELTEDIINSSDGSAVDVVFVVDASGSMQDNINAVAEHLGEMVDAYKASKIDYQLGLTHFSINEKNQNQNRILVFQLTQDLSKYKAELYRIQVGGDEHALDAINETMMKLRFRSNAVKHLILVTDEPFTSLHGFTVDDAINLCRKHKVEVNVLGIDDSKHKYLAAVTGGIWYLIPVNQ